MGNSNENGGRTSRTVGSQGNTAGSVPAENALDNSARNRSYSTGSPNAVSKSPRPAKRPLPTELDNGGRKHSASNGTQIVAGGTTRNASAPSLAPVPRGYINTEAAFQPATRKIRNVKKGVS